MVKKLLLDTDIGDDIDDAFALAMLAKLANDDLIGVTTVFRNTVKRAQQAKKLLDVMRLSVPVYYGERLPISEPIKSFEKDDKVAPENQSPCQWDESLADYAVTENGVNFIVERAKEYGENLVIVAIGPLTNVAKAILKDPDAMKKIDRIVLMGGWFTNYKPEWNIACDPEAANIVFSSDIPVYAVGLDVTLQCALDGDLLNDFKNSDLPHDVQIVKWLNKWFDYFGFEKSVMHDPLAVVSYFYDVCQFEKRYVKVNLTDNRGAIVCDENSFINANSIYVATKVDREKFYSVVRETLL